MQTLKENVKQAIIESAIAHFYERGYQDSSMRQIAKNAGITAGNMYRYFKNKEDLFNHILNPVYYMMINLIKDDDEKVPEKKETYLVDDLKNIGTFIAEKFNVYKREIYILINCVKGSKFENAKARFITYMEEHIIEHFLKYKEKTGIVFDLRLAHPFAISIIEGYLNILASYDDVEIKQKLIVEYTELLFGGFIKFL